MWAYLSSVITGPYMDIL